MISPEVGQIQEKALHTDFTEAQQIYFDKLMSELEKISGGLGFAELKEKAETGNKEALHILRDYIAKKEQIVEFIETKKVHPEEIAKSLVFDYFSNRQQETESMMKDPASSVSGGDFDIARCQAYIKLAKNGRFYEEFDLSGTYNGELKKLKEQSIFDFFKGIVEGTEKYIEAFKDNIKLVEKRKKLQEVAQKIVDAILEISD